MRRIMKPLRWSLLAVALSALGGCDDPQVYGSVGVSTGFSSGHWGGSGSRVHTSISVGGRIR
jgi:hypothetical protein